MCGQIDAYNSIDSECLAYTIKEINKRLEME